MEIYQKKTNLRVRGTLSLLQPLVEHKLNSRQLWDSFWLGFKSALENWTYILILIKIAKFDPLCPFFTCRNNPNFNSDTINLILITNTILYFDLFKVAITCFLFLFLVVLLALLLFLTGKM